MCSHEKIYRKGVILTSFPAKYTWECKNCGVKGFDNEPQKYNVDFLMVDKVRRDFILK